MKVSKRFVKHFAFLANDRGWTRGDVAVSTIEGNDMARQKKEVDWPALGLDYRSGVKSMRLLSREYGISTARIGQVAAEREWSRDLAVRIKARTQAKLDRSVLDSKLDAETHASEDQVIEANAQIQTGTILRHRADIRRARKVAVTLLEELEIATADNALLGELGKLMRSPDANGIDKLAEVYKKIIAFPSRVDVMRKLADTLKTLVGLEREAFGIDSKEAEGTGGIESVIKRVMAKQNADGC